MFFFKIDLTCRVVYLDIFVHRLDKLLRVVDNACRKGQEFYRLDPFLLLLLC